MAQDPKRNQQKDVEMSESRPFAGLKAAHVAGSEKGSGIDAASAAPITAAEEKVKYVRITTHGKMKTWIANTLAFFEDLDEEKSVVLHTLPQSIDPSSIPSPRSREPASGKDTFKPLAITSNAASSCTSQIPRLLSVVEILKREFMKKLEETKSTRMRGLEQYNELGDVEALGVVVSDVPVDDESGGEQEGNAQAHAEKQRSEMILQALSGKNHPRQSQTPFMRITLSLKERPDLVEIGATYQPPAVRKLSKSGKARAKKRAKKAQATALEEAKKAIAEAAPSVAAAAAA